MKRARRLVRVLAVLVAAAALSGCFQSLVLLKVNRDGSGTLEETMLLTDAFSQLIATLSGQQPPAESEQADPVDEAQLQEKARAMGEGVRLVSAEAVKNESGSGYRAVFSFPDISKIRVSQQPSAGMPAGAGPEQSSQEASVEDWLQFRFQRGATSTLEVLFPQPDDGEEAPDEEAGEEAGENPEMMDMMRQLYSDMRIRIAVEVAGRIAQTNARYVEGSRVTLVDADFGQLLQDEERFRELLNANPKSIEELDALIGDNPALRVETQPVVTIRFN